MFDPVTPNASFSAFGKLHFRENQLRMESFSSDLEGFPYVEVIKLNILLKESIYFLFSIQFEDLIEGFGISSPLPLDFFIQVKELWETSLYFKTILYNTVD